VQKYNTDLAVELLHTNQHHAGGVTVQKKRSGDITVTKMTVLNQTGAKRIGKPVGKYI